MSTEPKIIEEGAEQRPALEFSQTSRIHLSPIFGTRAEIESKIQESKAPLELQELLLKLNSLTDGSHTHWRLVAHIFPHNGGFDVAATISGAS